MRSVATDFRRGNLVCLHNPQRKNGISPKLSQPWEGTNVGKKGLSCVVYIRSSRVPRQSLRTQIWTFELS